MAAQKGISVLIKADNASTTGVTYVTVGGGRTVSMTINAETVDITSQDATDGHRELLGAAGIISMDMTIEGVFKDDAGYLNVYTNMMARSLANHQFVFPGWGTYTGPFQVTSLEKGGTYNGEATYSASFASADFVSFTATA